MELDLVSPTAVDRAAWVAEHSVLAPPAALPQLRILSTDTAQRIYSMGPNAIAFMGSTGADALLTVLIDGSRSKVRIARGTSAELTASRVALAVPSRFAAEVMGNVVTVWKTTEDVEIAA